MKAVEIKNLSFAYKKNQILSGVNLSIRLNDFVAIIGPNGGGKSTLMKLMVGLLKPSEGDVFIYGERVPQNKTPIGYVAQNTGKNHDFPITVAECVATGALGISTQTIAVKEALARVKMESYFDRRLSELSGGERQRVLIARALIAKPQILFLDEPTNNIDALGQQALYQLLKELNNEMTIIIVTHDIMTLSTHIKSIICVNQNVHYHEGAVLTPEMFRDAYGCEVELIAHGVPHRVLGTHDHSHGGCC